MSLRLRNATESDYAFSETLSRSNMQVYISARNMVWDPQRFADSWTQFENYIICRQSADIGLLRLLEVDGFLEIRDLQLLPKYFGQGTGTWAIAQTVGLASERSISALRLRVYEENPAKSLYIRLGFEPVAHLEGVIHMIRRLE